jgi:ABC-type branched-subunit amino acid transport system ATPase component
MRILHAIHDFLPRHAAGSEIYAFHLCRQLARRHDVRVLVAEHDSARAHVVRAVFDAIQLIDEPARVARGAPRALSEDHRGRCSGLGAAI